MDLAHIRFEGKVTIRRQGEAALVSRWTSRPIFAPVGQPPAPLTGVAALALKQAGLDPNSYRPAPLMRRVPACLRAMRAESEDAAWSRLESDHGLTSLAVNTLLIGVSKFFRDEPVFNALRTVVIPLLRERKHPLRVLSIGCSSGAELYSIAMLLAERGLLDRAELLGIDCRAEAISTAEAGIFAKSALVGLDTDFWARYMEPAPPGGWRVARDLCSRTAWRVADATHEIPPGPWDLVLCRNLFIYLQTRVVEGMFGQIAGQLDPAGFLVVGKAERPPSALKMKTVGPCIYTNHVR